MNHSRYVFLDGIRGIAAILVLTRHTGDYWHHSFYRSYLAVDLFFILSGFVIAYAYDEKIRSGFISVPKFFLIRLIRLYPVFLLSLILCSGILIGKLVLKHQINYADFSEIITVVALTALFLPSHFGANEGLFPINGPYWSLFFELIANFIYAVIRRFLTNSILTAIIISFGLMVAYVSFQHGNLDVGFLWDFESIFAGFVRSIFGVFLGLFLFRYQKRIEHYLNIKQNLAWLAVTGIALILSSPSAGRFNWLLDVLTVLFIFPFFVICASQGKTTKLQSVLLILGSASYPIYVLHKPVSELFAFIFKTHVGTFAPISGILLTLALIAISVYLEKYYDIPLRRWISNRAFMKR